MFIYNVTIKLTHNIHTQWVQWMQQTHIPAVMATGYFTSYTFAKLLDIDEEEGPTYTCQYMAISKANYNNYIATHSETLRNESFEKWGNQFITFRTVMQVVN